MTKVVAGQEYVYSSPLFNRKDDLVPIHCNSQHNPKHPCRVTPVKVGPKWSYALLTGYDKPVKIPTAGLVPIDEAKVRYRLGLERLERLKNNPSFIDRCVASL